MRTLSLPLYRAIVIILFAIIAISSISCGGGDYDKSASIGPPGPVLTDVSPRQITLKPNIVPCYVDGVPVRLVPIYLMGYNLKQLVLRDADYSSHIFYVRLADSYGPWSVFYLTRDYKYLIGDLAIPVPLLYASDLSRGRRLIVVDGATNQQILAQTNYSTVISIIWDQSL